MYSECPLNDRENNVMTREVNLATQAKASSATSVTFVDYWPGVENAETEVILRMQIALKSLGFGVLTCNRHGFLINDSSTHVDSVTHVLCVVALHFDSAPAWDTFTFFAAWNPINFYFRWGYREKSNNIIAADGFLSCSSQTANDHINRLLCGVNRHNLDWCELYHAVPGPILNPTIGKNRLFYCGINWEALSGSKGRHHDVLKLLDQKDTLDIYGPEIFQGVRVWDGFASYRGSIPFDGLSLVQKVARSGIGLVLSSSDHLDSGIMSNRLFECIGAGVPVIADMHPLILEHFKDCVLLVDSKLPPSVMASEIEQHVRWITENRDAALQMAARAQDVYLRKFSLEPRLREMIDYCQRKLNVESGIHREDFTTILFTSSIDSKLTKCVEKAYEHFNNPQHPSVVVVLLSAVPECIVSDFRRTFPNALIMVNEVCLGTPSKTHFHLIASLVDFVQSLPASQWLQIVMPWETPCYRRIHGVLTDYAGTGSFSYLDLGFSSVSGQDENSLTSTFITSNAVSRSTILDANSKFSLGSVIFKAPSIDLQIATLLAHSPKFWTRFFYLHLAKSFRGIQIGTLAIISNTDIYNSKYRPTLIEELAREVEYCFDFFTRPVLADLTCVSREGETNRAPVNPDAFVDELPPRTTRRLLGKLLNQVKIPKAIKCLGQFLWNKRFF